MFTGLHFYFALLGKELIVLDGIGEGRKDESDAVFMARTPVFDMLDKVVGIGLVHGSECDKFERFSLTRARAEKVNAPLISDCLAAIECRLEDHVERHGLLIFNGIRLWENPEKEDRRIIHANGDGTFFADGEFRSLREEMRQWVPEGSERL